MLSQFCNLPLWQKDTVCELWTFFYRWWNKTQFLSTSLVSCLVAQYWYFQEQMCVFDEQKCEIKFKSVSPNTMESLFFVGHSFSWISLVSWTTRSKVNRNNCQVIKCELFFESTQFQCHDVWIHVNHRMNVMQTKYKWFHSYTRIKRSPIMFK